MFWQNSDDILLEKKFNIRYIGVWPLTHLSASLKKDANDSIFLPKRPDFDIIFY